MPRKQKELQSKKGEQITPNLAFAIVLRQRRNELGLKQEDLEDDDGIDRSYISKLELGKNQVCLKNFISIAKKLNTTPELLMKDVMKKLSE